MLAGAGYWPIPPPLPPSFSSLANLPNFWSPQHPAAPFYVPALSPHFPHLPPPPQVANHHFKDSVPTSGHRKCSSSSSRPCFAPKVLAARNQSQKKLPGNKHSRSITQKIDVYEEEILAQAFVDQLITEEPEGKTVVEQVQQVNQTAQTKKDAPSGSGIVVEQNREGAKGKTVIEQAQQVEFDEDASNLMSRVKVGQYSVHSSLGPLLEAIINEYGDIAKNCIWESNSVRSSLLESICKVFQGMQVQAKDLDLVDFNNYYETLRNADKLGVDVKWLLERLDKYLAIVCVGRCKDLRDANKKNMEMRDSIKEAVEGKKSQVKELKLEIQELENKLDSKTEEIKRLETNLAAFASKLKLFRDKGLMEGTAIDLPL